MINDVSDSRINLMSAYTSKAVQNLITINCFPISNAASDLSSKQNIEYIKSVK